MVTKIENRGVPGAVIGGRYRVVDTIGSGGMGRVFRVTHLELDKSFALKLMRVELSLDPELRSQFYAEARLASAMRHPNIVSVVDFGEDPTCGAFMVMELLHGETLEDRIERVRPLPLRLVCEIGMQLADALHYIHGRGIVHADVKPGNVLIETRDGGRRGLSTKLLDFGLARVREVSHPNGARPATVVGTPAYMAPERLRGAPLAPTCDVYSLGVMMYELLTSVTPFRGTMAEVTHGHLFGEPAPIATHRDEPVDERLEQVVRRALAKDPADRPRNAGAFLYELRTCVDMLGLNEIRRPRRRRPRLSQRSLACPPSHTDASPAVSRQRAFDLCPLPMAIVDHEARVVAANPAFAKLIRGPGASGASLVGTSLADTALGAPYPRLAADLRLAAIRGAPFETGVDLAREGGDTARVAVGLALADAALGELLVTLTHRPDAAPALR